MLFSGTWGEVIHEKNLNQKISWHCPFKQTGLFKNYFCLRHWGCLFKLLHQTEKKQKLYTTGLSYYNGTQYHGK